MIGFKQPIILFASWSPTPNVKILQNIIIRPQRPMHLNTLAQQR